MNEYPFFNDVLLASSRLQNQDLIIAIFQVILEFLFFPNGSLSFHVDLPFAICRSNDFCLKWFLLVWFVFSNSLFYRYDSDFWDIDKKSAAQKHLSITLLIALTYMYPKRRSRPIAKPKPYLLILPFFPFNSQLWTVPFTCRFQCSVFGVGTVGTRKINHNFMSVCSWGSHAFGKLRINKDRMTVTICFE